jgi:hypothetical protein
MPIGKWPKILPPMTPEQERNYYAVELRDNMACEIRRRFSNVKVIAGDCQARMDVSDGFFDRYIGVHVLEHLPNLPACRGAQDSQQGQGPNAGRHSLRGKSGLFDCA